MTMAYPIKRIIDKSKWCCKINVILIVSVLFKSALSNNGVMALSSSLGVLRCFLEMQDHLEQYDNYSDRL
jgi:hypothetical protein